MTRIKIMDKGTVTLKEACYWRCKDGHFGKIRTLFGDEMFIVEMEGQCYAKLSDLKHYEDFCIPIVEKFDDIEGEEIKAGCDASENEGVSPAD